MQTEPLFLILDRVLDVKYVLRRALLARSTMIDVNRVVSLPPFFSFWIILAYFGEIRCMVSGHVRGMSGIMHADISRRNEVPKMS
jgi:hypothetical protein